MNKPNEIIVVLDFGGQYNQLIARRIRDLGVYSELLPYNTSAQKIKELSRAALFSQEVLPACIPRMHLMWTPPFMTWDCRSSAFACADGSTAGRKSRTCFET